MEFRDTGSAQSMGEVGVRLGHTTLNSKGTAALSGNGLSQNGSFRPWLGYWSIGLPGAGLPGLKIPEHGLLADLFENEVFGN